MKTLPENFNLDTSTCILKFSADWCGPCKAVTPVLEKVVEDTGVTIYHVDVDTHQELANQFNIRSIPAIVGIREGDPVGLLVGVMSQDKYEELAGKVLK